MGVDFRAVAVIGVRIPAHRFYKIETVPACAHVLVAGAKFCHECGQPSRQTRRVRVDGLPPGSDRCLGYPLHEDEAHDACFVGVMNGERTGYAGNPVERKDRVPLPADLVGETYARLKAGLEPLGLWDEEAFGLWAVPHAAY